MDKHTFFQDMHSKVQHVLAHTPVKDLEKNAKAMLTQGFARLDLVTREEFEIQSALLARARARLEALEARVAELEARLRTPE